MSFPLFKAFFAGVALFLSHLLTIVKILWLPALLMMAAMAYLMPSVSEAQMQMAQLPPDADPSEAFALMGPMWRSTGLMYLAMAVLYPMMTAGLLKHVVRGETPRSPFYFQFGFDELRVLAAFVLIIVMSIILVIVGSLVVGALAMIIGMLLGSASPALAALLVGVLTLVPAVVAIWFMIRLSVVFAAGIGTRSIGLGQSWTATRGASFSLFFYWLFWMIFLFIVSVPVMLFMMGDYFSLMGEMLMSASDPAAVEELERRLLETTSEMWDRSKPGFWGLIAANYVYVMFNAAVWGVGGGVAWRYLTGGERN